MDVIECSQPKKPKKLTRRRRSSDSVSNSNKLKCIATSLLREHFKNMLYWTNRELKEFAIVFVHRSSPIWNRSYLELFVALDMLSKNFTKYKEDEKYDCSTKARCKASLRKFCETKDLILLEESHPKKSVTIKKYKFSAEFSMLKNALQKREMEEENNRSKAPENITYNGNLVNTLQSGNILTCGSKENCDANIHCNGTRAVHATNNINATFEIKDASKEQSHYLCLSNNLEIHGSSLQYLAQLNPIPYLQVPQLSKAPENITYNGNLVNALQSGNILTCRSKENYNANYNVSAEIKYGEASMDLDNFRLAGGNEVYYGINNNITNVFKNDELLMDLDKSSQLGENEKSFNMIDKYTQDINDNEKSIIEENYDQDNEYPSDFPNTESFNLFSCSNANVSEWYDANEDMQKMQGDCDPMLSGTVCQNGNGDLQNADVSLDYEKWMSDLMFPENDLPQ